MSIRIATEKLTSYAPAVLRFGLVAVYAWFGASQLTNPSFWINIVPTWATGLSGLDANTIVHLNGIFEIIFALLLGIGVYVRPVAFLLFGHLIVIALDMGFNAIGVRDIGLSIATLAIAMFGEDKFCFTHKEEPTSKITPAP